MNEYALTHEPGLPQLLAELHAAAHSTDLNGVHRAIANLRVVPQHELGATVAMCWIGLYALHNDVNVELQQRLLAEGLCTTDDLHHAILGWTVRYGREQGHLHATLFDLTNANPSWAGALQDITRISTNNEKGNHSHDNRIS